MQMIDQTLEQQVWQRVALPPGEPSGGQLPALYHRSRCREGIYRQLAARQIPSIRRGLLNLARMEQEEGGSLRGLMMLQNASAGKAVCPPPSGSLRQVLTRLFREAAETEGIYTALSLQQQTGPVFSALARGKQLQAAKIMWLLGQLSQISEKIQK